MAFKVAIVGRPNVGKSTLFNRLVGRRIAIVDDTPGVTRDRRVHPGRLQDLRFDVVDTAGFEVAAADTLEGRMRAQTEAAISEADLIVFMMDGRAGLMPDDRAFADVVRRSGKPVVLAVNKTDINSAEAGVLEAWNLGLGEPVGLSAEHGRGMVELRDAIHAAMEEAGALEEEAVEAPAAVVDANAMVGDDIDPDEEDPGYDITKPVRIAVVGRPNAGKSTLINQIIGEDRLLTGPEAGITRDSISVDWSFKGRDIKLFDTAGMRRKAKVQQKLEKLSVADTLRAIRFAEVVIVVFDATMPFEKQDLQIADLIMREGRAPIIAFNKWDLIEDRQETLTELHEKTARLLPQVKGLQAIPISAETGRGIDKLFDAAFRTHETWNRRIPTGPLNRWLERATAQHPPPAVAGRRLKVKFITQIKTRPPGFVVSCSRPEAMPQSYVRYLTNGLRETFNITGVPIRMALRTSDNPYAHKAKKKR
ncbi:ribosome biogenesis GTPase Der [Nitratireductor basaltis]|uniref:GTPase Der n=1 Tax=Nitratireductor basaltis TaxID=472175 RepID=A0A084UCX0_9HYPH|nr:ribosome biogenesis GTPase Der [Nitratireductor basaltis]KFB10806.1 GTP-binding protein EngA [Nitratireductor basaltis]